MSAVSEGDAMSVPSEAMKFIKRERGDARSLINSEASPELIFAVVGPVGSGTSWVADQLTSLCKSALGAEQIVQLKASAAIENSDPTPRVPGGAEPPSRLDRASRLQDAGDALRMADPAAVASLLISSIKASHAKWDLQKTDIAQICTSDMSAMAPRVFILDSLKHPAEVELLRAVYREAFCLIGVVCEASARKSRLQNGKCTGSSSQQIDEFMKRDENAVDDWGQKVTDTFHLADYFVDNTPSRLTDDGEPNKDWVVPDKLGRLLDILLGRKVVRPLSSETGMFHAAGAQMRSACLSRQVGAALLDDRGNLLATGTNEVPKSGGGVYGNHFEDDAKSEIPDHRCAVKNKYCSNNRMQDEIMDEVIGAIPQLKDVADKSSIKAALKQTALGRLLEFSRAVHAEMDALLSAARAGISTSGTKLFVTTFPCHYCARHIVSAGVDEVQYIEPYPKSKALNLHSDAIEQTLSKWTAAVGTPLSKVLFRPFTGVAPRLYRRAFIKNRKLKDDAGAMSVGEPSWAPGLLRKSYLQLETSLEDGADNGQR